MKYLKIKHFHKAIALNASFMSRLKRFKKPWYSIQNTTYNDSEVPVL